MDSPGTRPGSVRKKMGDFEIVRELGRGGMGIVYEARQVSLNRRVALKVLPNGLGMTQAAQQRFHREAQAAARLHHSNIIAVYAEGVEDGTCYYAMELVDGEGFDQIVAGCLVAGDGSTQTQSHHASSTPTAPPVGAANESLPAPASGADPDGGSPPTTRYDLDQVAQWVADLADALHYAHQEGVIHRDVKPSNLILGRDGRPRLMDFGLARMLEEPGMTQSGEFLGTPRYMSPEQIAVGRMRIDHRTDIYSLGVTLYELLTRSPAFSGGSRDQLIGQIMSKEPTRPRRLDRQIPVDLETICLTAMDKDPDRRYPSAGEMAEDLRRYLNRFAISAKRVGPLGRAAKWVRRKPAVAALSLCVFTAVAFAGSVAWHANRVQAERLAERRQSLRDEAMLETMRGDFAAAEAAIDRAEQLGEAANWVHLLRGQAALRSGHSAEAIGHLEEATELEPDSAAAHAMLHYAHLVAGDWMRYVEGMRQLQTMQLSTFEDYLFAGQAVSYGDPERSLQWLDRANRHRKTAVGYLTSAEARINHAWSSGDVAIAERAIQEATIAQDMLRDSLEASCLRVFAHLVAVTLYRHADRHAEADRHLSIAGDIERTLPPIARGSSLPLHLFARGFYYEYAGRSDDALEFYRQLAQSNHLLAIKLAAYNLYRQARYEEALAFCDRARELPQVAEGIDSIEISRAFVLLETEDGPRKAREVFDAFRDAALAQDKLTFYPTVHFAEILHLLGRNDEARRFMSQIRPKIQLHPLNPEWYDALLDFFCGEIGEQELVEAADSRIAYDADVHFYVGLRKLGSGQQEEALAHLQKAKQMGLPPYYEFYWSWGFADQLQEDLKWPRLEEYQ